MPVEAARFCLEYAGIKPSDIDIVALPYAEISLLSPARWHYAKRYWYAPDRVVDVLLNGNRRYRRYIRRVRELLEAINVDWHQVEFDPIEHHVAHASSAYHLSGFQRKDGDSLYRWQRRIRHDLLRLWRAWCHPQN